MFEDRANWIGIGLLILCGISAGALLGYIDAGQVARFSGPGWLGVVITIAFFGLFIYGMIQMIRGKALGDDVRGQRRRWWRRGR